MLGEKLGFASMFICYKVCLCFLGSYNRRDAIRCLIRVNFADGFDRCLRTHHMEHTLLLNRKRVNKGMKRTNS